MALPVSFLTSAAWRTSNTMAGGGAERSKDLSSLLLLPVQTLVPTLVPMLAQTSHGSGVSDECETLPRGTCRFITTRGGAVRAREEEKGVGGERERNEKNAVLTNDRFGRVLHAVNVCECGRVWGECVRVWTRVDECGRVWTCVDVCGCVTLLFTVFEL